jgi:glycosyltransferase involved in cell wall biosynthesis
MRILLVHYDELDALGGVELLVRQLAEAFTEAGHPTGIVEMGGRWRGRRSLTGGTPIWTVGAASFPAWNRPRSWASAARATLQLRRAIREWDAQIVHVHFPIGQSIPAVGAHALPHGWRLAVTVHNSEIRVAPRSDPRVAVWQRRLFARADAVSAVSGSMLADTCRRYPGVQAKGVVIYNGIGEYWLEEPRPPARVVDRDRGRPYVLFAGRLHPMKGVDILLRAWREIAQSEPGVELRLAGEGPEGTALKRMVEEWGLSAEVRFLGAVENRALKALYREAEAVILPSRAEGFPLTLLEASACGALCVGSDIPGIAEIIDEAKTGFLFPAGSVGALTERLRMVLHLGRGESARVRAAAYEKVKEHFMRPNMVGDYLQFYRDLLEFR